MKKLSTLFLVLSLVFSCGENAIDPEFCPPNLVCTEEIRYLTFSPLVNGEALILDDYYVRNMDTGGIYQASTLNEVLEDGQYLVVSDVMKDEIQREGTVLRFVGAKDNQVVIEQDFLVGDDCCHIKALEGPFDSETE